MNKQTADKMNGPDADNFISHITLSKQYNTAICMKIYYYWPISGNRNEIKILRFM